MNTPASKPITIEELNIGKLGGRLWGWLSSALTAKAHDYFEPSGELNGFNGRRVTVHQIHQEPSTSRGALRRTVGNMPHITKLEGVGVGILCSEGIMGDFINAGGVIPTDGETKEDLLDALPNEIREELLLRATTAKESFQAFAGHVKTSVSQIIFQEGKLSSSPNLADGPGLQSASADDNYEEDLLAM